MRPRIMHVISGLGVGGAENMLALLARADAANGGAPLVVSMGVGGSNASRLIDAGIRLEELDMERSPVGGFRRLVGLIRKTTPDIVQSWMYHADVTSTLALALSGRRSRTRLAWGIRCSDLDTRQYGMRLRTMIRASVPLSRFPDAAVANSHAGRDHHLAMGYRPPRFDVIPNGIDIEAVRPDAAARVEMRRELGLEPDQPVLISVARVDPLKDHATLLAMLDRLPEVTMLSVGLDTDRLPDRPNLKRLGRRTDVARLLNAADLFVSSSAFGEGFSTVIAEAMSAGLPVVATGVGDARRILGDTGIVVPPRDPEALAAAVKRLADEPDAARAARGRAARERIGSQFSLRQAIANFRDFHASL